MGKKAKQNDDSANLWIRVLCGILGALMVFGVVVMVISSFLTDSYADEEDEKKYNAHSDKISVGLSYLSSAVQGYTLSSSAPLRLSTDNLIITDGPKEVTVSFDGNEYMYNGEITDNTNGVLIVGGYHIRISFIQTSGGGSSSENDNPVLVVPGASGDGGSVSQGFTKDNIDEYITGLDGSDIFRTLGVYSFPTYHKNDCYISVGDFSSKEDAAEILGELQKNFVMTAEIVGPAEDMITVHDADNKILFETDTGSHLEISSSDNSPIASGRGERFYGSFEFTRDNSAGSSTLGIINTLGIEDYVKSVMSAELSSSYSPETLKACAIVFRTLAYRMHGVHDEYGFDVCSSSHCQKYLGCASVSDTIISAVKAVEGRVLTYKNELIYPVFHVSGGSTTVSSLDAVGKEISYLEAKNRISDGYDTVFDEWKTNILPSELSEVLRAAGYDGIKAGISTISIDKRGENSLYVSEITFTDILGNSITISGSENIRAVLNGVIESTAFIVGKSGSIVTYKYYDANGREIEEERAMQGIVGYFVFSGEGNGSGVGLSFEGAEKLANAGGTFADIVSFYYSGAAVAKVNIK